MRRDDPTRLKPGSNGSEAFCSRCGAETTLPKLPAPLAVWTAAAKAFAQQHRACSAKKGD